MPLSKDILGLALYNATAQFNDVTIDPTEMEVKRLEQWKVVAETIINHIKTAAVVATTGTAAAQTGTIT